MHYNLNERLKPKKHIPYKKIIILCVVILIVAAVYVLVFRNSGQTPVDVSQPT